MWFLRIPALFVCLFIADACYGAPSRVAFDPRTYRWVLSNGWVEAVVGLTPGSSFALERITDLRSGDVWVSPSGRPSSLFSFRVGQTWIDGQTAVDVLRHTTEEVQPSGTRLTIWLQDQKGTGRVELAVEIYDGHPVLRCASRYMNLAGETVRVNAVNMTPWAFGDAGKRYTAFRVNQWVTDNSSQDFTPLQSALDPGGKMVEVFSGSHGQQCGWLALRDDSQRGLFTGWEFDGRARIQVRHMGADGWVQLTSSMPQVNHPVAHSRTFEVPAVFLGLFHGDWDEAGYRTQRFAEAVLAKPEPDPGAFPYVGWDSWAYQDKIHEDLLRRNAEMAAALGVELFTVDLGWSRKIGDWYPDPEKFPSGLRALSDYVHSLGMKFGLHFALTEAAPDSAVLREHPEWTSTESDNYFGARSLCLSNAPTREWIVEQAIRLIDDYNVDWILQDGENMVKQCTRTIHTHDPGDSNYSNAVDGINAILQEVQRRRPKASWENCENGGNMMTFNMVRLYVTSITNDASGSLSSRRAVYGVTFPFPPRYADRYMPEQTVDAYTANSYLFGGPWVLMNRLIDLPADQREYLAGRIRIFKQRRAQIANGKVFHLSAQPAAARIDAIQGYDPRSDSAIAVVSRPDAPQGSYLLRPRGLDPAGRYQVTLDNNSRTLLMNGEQLMRDGVRVNLPAVRSSDVVYIDPK